MSRSYDKFADEWPRVLAMALAVTAALLIVAGVVQPLQYADTPLRARLALASQGASPLTALLAVAAVVLLLRSATPHDRRWTLTLGLAAAVLIVVLLGAMFGALDALSVHVPGPGTGPSARVAFSTIGGTSWFGRVAYLTQRLAAGVLAAAGLWLAAGTRSSTA
jgi:hypothetical protein